MYMLMCALCVTVWVHPHAWACNNILGQVALVWLWALG